MFSNIKNLFHSPFGIAAVAGVCDLVGGTVATLTDIYWLVFDTMIKTSEMSVHPIAYGSMLAGLIIAAVHLLFGLVFTIACYRRYKMSGLESHERKLVIEHIKETKCSKNRKTVLCK